MGTHGPVSGMAVRTLWVIDKVQVTQRIHFADGRSFEYPHRFLEWPIQPPSLAEWRDVMSEALTDPFLRNRLW